MITRKCVHFARKFFQCVMTTSGLVLNMVVIIGVESVNNPPCTLASFAVMDTAWTLLTSVRNVIKQYALIVSERGSARVENKFYL